MFKGAFRGFLDKLTKSKYLREKSIGILENSFYHFTQETIKSFRKMKKQTIFTLNLFIRLIAICKMVQRLYNYSTEFFQIS